MADPFGFSQTEMKIKTPFSAMAQKSHIGEFDLGEELGRDAQTAKQFVMDLDIDGVQNSNFASTSNILIMSNGLDESRDISMQIGRDAPTPRAFSPNKSILNTPASVSKRNESIAIDPLGFGEGQFDFGFDLDEPAFAPAADVDMDFQLSLCMQHLIKWNLKRSLLQMKRKIRIIKMTMSRHRGKQRRFWKK